MLSHIYIQDFAIIDTLDLELEPGMCVLTGETGAGKSILVDALGLVLGDRADSEAIRHGADRAEISIEVDIRDLPEVKAWLAKYELGADEACIVRRVITREGRSRAYVNGSPTSLSVLRLLGQRLVDIHGQHEHQSLLRRDMQRKLLDTYAVNEKYLQELERVYRNWQSLKRKLETSMAEADERNARVELLRYQIQELSQLGLGDLDIHALDQEQQRLANVERLQEGSNGLYLALYESDEQALYSQLGRLIGILSALSSLDSRLTEWLELLTEAQLRISEAANGLRRYSSNLDADPQRLEWIESRLTQVHDLARKHRVPMEELRARLTALESELQVLENPEFDLHRLAEKLDGLETEYRHLAGGLHTTRTNAAAELSQQTTTAMQHLGMKGGRFQITVELDDASSWSTTGLDRIEFLVSTNPGQPLKPLAKVASGGELSRISLAIQMVAAKSLTIPTLIFDEVDSGIGGAVAEVVGRQLQTLGENRQVLCVTHLPQVAVHAQYHYQVSKFKRHSVTLAHIVSLKPQQRIDEIARMLGGLEMTEQTRAHAQEMINRAQTQ